MNLSCHTSRGAVEGRTTTVAKKGGDNIGFSGHKHLKGEKVVPFCDRNCNVIAPLIAAPGNRNESPLLREALPQLTGIAQAVGIDLRGSIVSLDGVYDSKANRTAIFKERFRTIERVFAWGDKFRRVLVRYEVISDVHYAFRTLAYMMINLCHFCRS